MRRKQEIVFAEIAAHTVGDAPFDIVAKATSGLAVTLEVVSGPAVLDGKSLKLTGEPGLVIVRASQQGNALFQPALDAERAFTVHARPSAPVITLPAHGVERGAGGEPVLLAVEATGEPEPAFQWRKDGSAITGANGRRLSIAMAALADAGGYDVVASNASGEVRSSVARVTVGKRHQAISFQPATAALAGQPVPLVASASSGLPVQFDVVSGAAFLSGNTLTSQGGLVVVQGIAARGFHLRRGGAGHPDLHLQPRPERPARPLGRVDGRQRDRRGGRRGSRKGPELESALGKRA